MKEIDNETLITAANKILDMLKKGGVGFSMPGQFNCSTEDLKFLIERQLKHPDRNQFEDFASIEHLTWSISEYFDCKKTNDFRDCGIQENVINLIDLFLGDNLCRCPTDSYRPKVEEYRDWVVKTLKQWEVYKKRREQRLARIAKKKEQEAEKGESE